MSNGNADSCILCKRPVRKRQQGLQCDGCERWQHRTCEIRSGGDINWRCEDCFLFPIHAEGTRTEIIKPPKNKTGHTMTEKSSSGHQDTNTQSDQPTTSHLYDEEDDDDNYIKCQQCSKWYNGECPTHRFIIVKDRVYTGKSKKDNATKSLPENLRLKRSSIPEAGKGVFAMEAIKPNTIFGPYRGEVVVADDFRDGRDPSYMWEIVKGGKTTHVFDGIDPSRSNWLRFINCARSEDEQNIVAYQYHGDVYYRVYKQIEAGVELLVYYGDEYAEGLGIQVLPVEQEILQEQQDCHEEKLAEEGGHTCKHCGRMYTYFNYLEAHLKRCPILVCYKTWDCPHCSRKYSSEDYLSLHIKNDCRNPNPKKRANAVSVKQLCKLRRYSLRSHSDESRPHQCEHCPKTFTRQHHLQEHERTHSGERPYQCEHCRKTFTLQHNLKRHQRIHSGERPFQSEHCPKTFTQQHHLQEHERIHSGERPYQCEHCPKTFTLQGHLKRHQRIHSGERPYQCEHCPKTFTQQGDLKRHKRVHSGERPHQCEHCRKTFTLQGNLKRHEKRH